MRILILGGGTVGSSIASLLCNNRHSVTVVDDDADTVKRINDELDVRALTGSASESSVLFQAGAFDADLCLAVTGVDEVNLVAASLAKGMGVRRSVARVYAPVFRDASTFDYQRHFHIDRLLSLEHLSAMELARGIRSPGSVAVESFGRGQLEVQEIMVQDGAECVGTMLKELSLPRTVRIGSILREGRLAIALADNRLQPEDRITLIGGREEIDSVRSKFQTAAEPKRNVVIAGGGETGYHLAQALEGRRFGVVLMEAEQERCEFLAANLKHTTVVKSDATRRSSLEEERAGSADIFVACMGDDENNIMAGVEARELGAQSVLAVVNRPDYANVVGKLGIDHAVSPRRVMAKQVLGLLTTGALVSRTSLGNGGISILEIEVFEDVAATEHVLAKLELPEACLIAAVIQEDYVRVPGADDRLKPGDTVVAMVEDAVMEETLKFFSREGRS